MKQINLIDSTESDVSYELTTFPDGEPHIAFKEAIDRKDIYTVKCRITNPNELFVLMQVADILNRNEVIWGLKIFYLMSARMDRVIHFEEAFSLKLVANIINSMNAFSVGIFHCHSDRAFSLINDSYELDREDIYPWMVNASVLCYPDAGAKVRYAEKIEEKNVCNEYHWYHPLMLNKVRDLENKGYIKSIDIVENEDKLDESFQGNIMIIDDLCDAGGTFILSAKMLKEKFPKATLSIFVRHLVNPIGLKNLQKTFNQVYITNSYKDWNEDIKREGYTNVSCFDILRN